MVSLELVGNKFGKLTIISKVIGKSKKYTYWKCVCECGKERVVRTDHLRSGRTKDCGCWKHGKVKTRLYNIYCDMKERCNNPNSTSYPRYGSVGIKVCSEWQQGFMCFYEWAIANGYSNSLTIDRIDNEKGYSPDNCRWVDYYAQANNKRNNHVLTINNISHTVAEWSRITGLKESTIRYRVRMGWKENELLIPLIPKGGDRQHSISKERLRQLQQKLAEEKSLTLDFGA